MATRSMASITRQAPNMAADDQDWRAEALCKNWDFKKKGDPWHPASESRIAAIEGKNLCGGCKVRFDCLIDAVHSDTRYGIRGGQTPDERRRLRK